MAITEAVRTRDSKSADSNCPDSGAAGSGATGSKALAQDEAGVHGEAPVLRDAAVHGDAVRGDGGTAGFRPIPVWFFAFEGLMGASYDIVKSSPHAWMLLAASAAVNIVLARTVLRGRLRMARAMLKGKRTRKIAAGLIALRIGVHIALGAAGMQATSGPAHMALAAAMCAATVGLLAFDQHVMLRALAAA